MEGRKGLPPLFLFPTDKTAFAIKKEIVFFNWPLVCFLSPLTHQSVVLQCGLLLVLTWPKPHTINVYRPNCIYLVFIWQKKCFLLVLCDSWVTGHLLKSMMRNYCFIPVLGIGCNVCLARSFFNCFHGGENKTTVDCHICRIGQINFYEFPNRSEKRFFECIVLSKASSKSHQFL